MKLNYNTYLENKKEIEKFILLENYLNEKFYNKNEILYYYENDYKIKDNFNTFYFYENENNKKYIDKKFYRKLNKLIDYIEKLNIECFIILFDYKFNYNFYEMKLFINFYNDKKLKDYLKITNKHYKEKILIL